MSKKVEKGLEATLADYLLNPKKYKFGLKNL
ncbi:hypothetical protein ES705_17020 [subsurface metagenome]